MRTIFYSLCIIFFLFTCQFSVAQVGIGTTTPVASSLLDLTSTSKGMLVPRMTLAQKLAIASPATGLLIYQTDGAYGFWYYNGSAWVPFLSGSDGWRILGNTGTVAGTNFIGTTDAVDFVTKTNGTERMRVLSGGNVGIGTTSPGSTLDIKGTLRLSGSASGYVGFQPAAAAGSTTYTLPSADGTSGQQLSTNGAGVLSWANQTGTTTNTLSLSTNTLTSTVNGVGATASVVGSVSNTSSANTLSTTVNGVTGATVNIINSNATSLSGANLTTTVNGVAASALDLTPAIGAVAWKLVGNSGTTAGTNFIGTTDGVDFVTKTNNSEKMRVTSAGLVGIGTSAPTAGSLLDVKGHLVLSNGGTASEIRLYEPSAGGANYTGFKSQIQAANITYTLPSAQGAANTQLTNDGTGTLSWGTGNIQFAQKTADESVTNSSTLQDDAQFTFTLGANQTYEVGGVISATCGSTGLLKMQFVAPTGSTEFITVFVNRDAADDITYMTSPTTAYQIASSAVSNTSDFIMVNGTIKTAGTSGTFKLQWAQQTSNGTSTTFYTNSYLKVTLVK